MGDALLQKTYTADFLTKRQVKNNGEVAQVYVRDSHKGIVDKETWNAVQEEFERREKFMQKHGTDRYSYGSECYPFCEKIFCGECGSLFTRHSWKSRGIIQWQCKNHRKDGKVACTNAYVDNADLEKGFIKAFNRLVGEREKHIEITFMYYQTTWFLCCRLIEIYIFFFKINIILFFRKELKI